MLNKFTEKKLRGLRRRREVQTIYRTARRHERLTYFHQGRRFRVTDVYRRVVEDLIG